MEEAERDELVSIKTELKCWESMFTRKYKKKPTKEDIDSSAPEIQDSYRRYAKLKSKERAESKQPEVSKKDDDVFGQNLNKKISKAATRVLKRKIPIKLDSSLSWRPKLKPMKQAAASVTREEGEQLEENEKTADRTESTTAKHQDLHEETKNDDNNDCYKSVDYNIDDSLSMTSKISTKTSPITKPASDINRKFRSNLSIKRRHSLLKTSDASSSSWLDSCKESLEASEQIPNKLCDRTLLQTVDTSNGSGIAVEKENFAPENSLGDTRVYSIDEIIASKSSEQHCENDRTSRRNDSSNYEAQVVDYKKKESHRESPGIFEPSEISKNEAKHTSDEASVVPPLAAANDEVDFDSNANKRAAPAKKTRRNLRKTAEGAATTEVDAPTGTAIPTKKRKRTKAADDDEDETNTKKMKISKKAAATKGKRLVSDNFVKIDLRKKTYVRGLNKTSVSLQKRRAWKRKTAFEQPSKTGKKTCFKCGGEGHWAKFCRGRPKQVDLFKKLDEEKTSLEYKSLAEQRGSCFDQLYVDNSLNGTSSNSFMHPVTRFGLEDIMDITPCWPRTPYITEETVELMDPLVPPDHEEPSKEAFDLAKDSLNVFGFDGFREGQHGAIARILSGLSTLVILATGSGKSLCYQLPAYLYYKKKGWMTIVVSPLVALMQDQVAGLPSCLPGVALNSNMTKLQQQKAITKIKDGKVAILLVSPEALVSGGFGTGILPPKSSLPPIAFACIDEAHCLSEWSRNFRPSYLKVCKVLRERYQIRCLLGLTATASNKTAKSVIQHLGVSNAGSIIRDPNPIPSNLQITASRDDNRDAALVELLQNEPFDTCDSIIVYATRRTDCDRLAVLLRTSIPDFVPSKSKYDEVEDRGSAKKTKTKSKSRKKDAKPSWWNCESYHAGLTPAQRKRVQNQFMAGELRIVVATVAFGMGLDKSDVRSVIHYNMPKSFENYVQEIGRAGRDGKPSFCHAFLTDDVNDLCELKRHIYGDTIDRYVIQQFVEMLFPPCECDNLYKTHELAKSTNDIEEEEDFFKQEFNESDLELIFSEDMGIEETTEEHALCPDREEKSDDLDNNLTKDEKSIEISDNESKLVVADPNSEPELVAVDSDNKPESVAVNPNNESKFVIDFETSNEDCLETTKDTGDSPPERSADKVDRADESDCSDEYEMTHCMGHRRALAVDQTINDLNLRQEIISTLLAYLELHPKTWLRTLNPLRAFCTIKCYGGPEQFQMLARKFPPVALAVRLLSEDEKKNLHERRQIEFDFVDIADRMCWDVLTVLRELKALQWNMAFSLDAPLNTTGKSGIIVEMTVLSFHFTTAPGVGAGVKDKICDFLHLSVITQEETRLLQLDALYCVLKELSCQGHRQIPTNRRIDVKARQQIGQFFLCKEEQQLDFLRSLITSDLQIVTPSRRWNNIASDIRSLVHSYPDTKFSGRSAACIFQGIDTPKYPALTFGRDRRFWRQYIDVDFNELKSFAVRELARIVS